jgi:hypothetical protein
LLTISGEVVEAQGIEPPDFVFDKLTAGESKSASVFVMAMVEDSISVSEAQLTKAEFRPFFEVQIDPVPRDVLPNAVAKSGVRITLTARPGMPLGSFNQMLAIRTSLPGAEELKIPIVGRVVGDVSLHGPPEWSEEQSVLRLGTVKSSQGKSVRLYAVIRGPAAERAALRVVSSDPPVLRATVGEPNRLKEGLVHVPVEIEVPPGTPPMIRLGTVQGEEGRVVLDGGNPEIGEIVIGVRFLVER